MSEQLGFQCVCGSEYEGTLGCPLHRTNAVPRVKRGDRGFLGYGEPFCCTYGTTVRTYESSSADGDHMWLALDQDDKMLHRPTPGSAHAHLSYEQAQVLHSQIGAWLVDHSD